MGRTCLLARVMHRIFEAPMCTCQTLILTYQHTIENTTLCLGKTTFQTQPIKVRATIHCRLTALERPDESEAETSNYIPPIQCIYCHCRRVITIWPCTLQCQEEKETHTRSLARSQSQKLHSRVYTHVTTQSHYIVQLCGITYC